MSLYERLYHILFHAITDATEIMPEGKARRALISAQQQCEELYMEEGEEEPEDTKK